MNKMRIAIKRNYKKKPKNILKLKCTILKYTLKWFKSIFEQA